MTTGKTIALIRWIFVDKFFSNTPIPLSHFSSFLFALSYCMLGTQAQEKTYTQANWPHFKFMTTNLR